MGFPLPTSLNWLYCRISGCQQQHHWFNFTPRQHLHGLHHFPCRTGRWWQLGGHLGLNSPVEGKVGSWNPHLFTGFQKQIPGGYCSRISRHHQLSIFSWEKYVSPDFILLQTSKWSWTQHFFVLTVCHPSTRWVLQPVTPPITRTPGRAFLGKIPTRRG